MPQTLIEFAKTVSDPVRKGIIETLYLEEPIYQYIPWRPVPGLALPYTSEKELPSVGFRKLNEAFAESVGVVQRNVETLKPFGGDSDTDKVLVDAYGNSERAVRDQMFAKAMAIKYIQFLCYGNSPASRAGVAYDDVDGFDGLMNRITAAQTVDGGATGKTDGSSVFAIRFGDGYVQGLNTPVGVDSRDLGEQDSKPVMRTRIDMTAGLAIYHGKAVAYIKDLAAAGTLLTVDMMDELRDKIAGPPSVYIMSKRSRRQLLINARGLGINFGMTLDQLGRPIEAWGGVPIIVSDAIIDTETNT